MHLNYRAKTVNNQATTTWAHDSAKQYITIHKSTLARKIAGYENGGLTATFEFHFDCKITLI